MCYFSDYFLIQIMILSIILDEKLSTKRRQAIDLFPHFHQKNLFSYLIETAGDFENTPPQWV